MSTLYLETFTLFLEFSETVVKLISTKQTAIITFTTVVLNSTKKVSFTI